MVRETREVDGDGVPPGVGEYERFVEAFNRFETELFDTCVDSDGVPWWDIVRFEVQYSLSLEQGLKGRVSARKSPTITRILSFVRQSFRLLRDIVVVRRMKYREIDTIFVTTRVLPPITEAIENRSDSCLVVCGPRVDPGQHPAIAKQSIDFFVRLVWRCLRITDDITKDMVRIDRELRRHFESSVDCLHIMASKYRRHRAARIAWSYLISQPKAITNIVYVNDDSLKTLVQLARAHGFATEEVQHGYMGSSHGAFTYPPLSRPLATLPDRLIVTMDTGDIVYPVPKVQRQSTGAGSDFGREETIRDIDVLLGASPRRLEEITEVLTALMGMDLTIAIKLHPMQSEDELSPLPDSALEQVIIFSGEVDFGSVVRRSKIYLPINPVSTTGFEAFENGTKLIVIDYDGIKLSGIVDGIVTERLNRITQLPPIILKHLNREIVNEKPD